VHLGPLRPAGAVPHHDCRRNHQPSAPLTERELLITVFWS